MDVLELMREAALAGRNAIRRGASPNKKIRVERKADGSLLTRADGDSHKAVTACLRKHARHVPILSEEGETTGDLSRLNTGEWFVLDPLDGTTNFSRGIDLFSISLAYVVDGIPQAGLVLPVMEEHYFAALRGRPAEMVSLYDGRIVPLCCTETKRSLKKSMLCIACNFDDPRSRRQWRKWVKTLGPPTCHRLRIVESAALELCWLAQGKVDAYLHPSNKPWDIAAGVLIAAQAGARLYGKAGTPWRLVEPGLLAAPPRLAKEILARNLM